MKNIIDYIRQFGNLSFHEKPFTDVDSLILSQLTYMDFGGIVPTLSEGRLAVTLGETSQHPLREKMFVQSVGEKDNRKLFSAMENSKRFSSLRLNYYEYHLDIEREKQFAAITYGIGENKTYIAFRGTDQYLASWKEDFNMTYKGPIPAQLHGLQYLEEVGKLEKGELLVGGHSKGGNLALYACIYCAKVIRDRVTAIYSHDGPGMRKEVYEEEVYKELVPRIFKTIPQSSIVGMLLYQRELPTIIYSNALTMGQHYPYSWVIEGEHFKKVHQLKKDALAIDRGLKKWLEDTDDERRKLFVDTIYQVISKTGIATIYEIKDNIRTGLFQILESTKEIDEETRQSLREILRTLLKNVANAYRK